MVGTGMEGMNSIPFLEPYPEGTYTMFYGDELFVDLGMIIDMDEDEVLLNVNYGVTEGIA